MPDKNIGNVVYYNLAWIDTILSSLQGAAEEVEVLCNIIKTNAINEVKLLLHFGCGAAFVSTAANLRGGTKRPKTH